MQPAAAEGPNALDGRAPAETFQLVPAQRRPPVAVTPPPPLRQLPPTMMQSLKNMLKLQEYIQILQTLVLIL